MTRFIDNEFVTKPLLPICGYWSEKVVPLEQALKPLIPSIEQLDRSVQAAKKYCHFPSEHDLTHDESAALYLYTMEGGENSFYRILNQALRSEDRPALRIWFPYLKLLDTALSKLPTVQRNIWRGVIGDIGKDLKKNELLTWWNVSSCSLSVDVIKDFLSSETSSTLFLIEAVHGKDISLYTNYPDEEEILLAPGIQLRVIANAVNLPGGLNVIHLAEVNDDNHQNEVLTNSTEKNILRKA
uniref:NAD(P)(+)--arginine ADP-ribosyltransferase n=1 Tax=Adineta vaga TaxID=104782 RepID=B3G4I4_ADIVA|nr:ADP-ribosyltransferase 1-like protein [Adineta vaga]